MRSAMLSSSAERGANLGPTRRRSRTMSDLESLRLRASASISATMDSGSRTVRVFMRALYYAPATPARQRENLGKLRGNQPKKGATNGSEVDIRVSEATADAQHHDEHGRLRRLRGAEPAVPLRRRLRIERCGAESVVLLEHRRWAAELRYAQALLAVADLDPVVGKRLHAFTRVDVPFPTAWDIGCELVTNHD